MGEGIFSYDPLGRPRGRTVRTPTRIASPPGVRCRPAEGARPRCTLSHCQNETSDRLNRVLTLERYLFPCSCFTAAISFFAAGLPIQSEQFQ